MSITVKLKEVAKPKFNVGDVLKSKDGEIEPFEVIKIEVSRDGIRYLRADGFLFLEKHLKLHEEEKPQLTFGDVPVGSGFIECGGSFCIKIHDASLPNNTLMYNKATGALFNIEKHKNNPIQRIIPNIEIREVD